MEEDKKLYEMFLYGDKNAFEKLTFKYKNNLIYFISRYVKNIEIAEDIFQEVMLFILEKKDYYNSNYSFKTYIYMIAKSKALDYIKKDRRTESLEELKIDFEDNTLLEEIILIKERKNKIKNVMKKMSSEYQLVIYLTQIEGLSYKETGLILDKTESQIKTMTFNARKKLKQLLIKEKVIEIKNHRIIMLIAMFVFISVAITGVTYAGKIIFDFIQKETKTDFENNKEYDDYNEDMLYSDGIYYKTILDYQNYKNDKKKWNGLVEMRENDFNDYFVVVIAGENYSTTGLYISDIKVDDENLYIDLNKKDIWNGSTVISAKLEKTLYRENIIVKNNPNIPQVSKEFIKMEDIPIGYTKEEAIEDGLIVIDANKIISNEKNRFNEFIENANNGISDFIRIYNYDIIQNITIIDLEYKNGIINMSQCNKTQPGNNIIYNSGNEIIKSNGSGIYWLKDEMGNKKVICNIEL